MKIKYSAFIALAALSGCGGSSSEGESDGSITPQTVTAANNIFFEDFSQPILDIQLSETSGGTLNFEESFAIARVESVNDFGDVSFRPQGIYDSISADMTIESGSSFNSDQGQIAAQITARFFNDTTPRMDVDTDCVVGDVEVRFGKFLEADDTSFFRVDANRHTQTDCNNAEDAFIFDGDSRFEVGSVPIVDVSNQMGVSVDRENRLLTLTLDEQSFSFSLLTDVFLPSKPSYSILAQINNGAASAVVRFDEILLDGTSIDFSDPESIDRFRFFDSDNPNTSISYPDGELRLESLATGEDRVNNRLAIPGNKTQYARAQVRLSSESLTSSGGEVFARVGGALYYASDDAGNESALNQVFANTDIILLENGTLEAVYCASQSLDENFDDFIALVNSENESGCNTFVTTPVLDQNYTFETWLDEENSRIVFAIDDEVHFHEIEGPISVGEGLFDMRVQSGASGEGSRAVVFIDNLETALGAAAAQ